MKTAVITGTSQRLGLYLCAQFANLNWRVIAVTRNASERLRELEGPHVEVIELGSYSETSLARMTKAVLDAHPSIDLLINNASLFTKDTDITGEQGASFNDLVFMHMSMPAQLIAAFHSALSQAQGNIISITDIYSDNPNPEFSLYCSTKAGLKSLTLSAAKNGAPTIRANCIQPGPLKFLPSHSQTDKDKVMNETLLPFEGGFDPVFKTVKFIIDNNYLTGQCINVDGGRALMRG